MANPILGMDDKIYNYKNETIVPTKKPVRYLQFEEGYVTEYIHKFSLCIKTPRQCNPHAGQHIASTMKLFILSILALVLPSIHAWQLTV
jgi:hypothetical protein